MHELQNAEGLCFTNNATSGPPVVYKIDLATGQIVDYHTNLSGYNGRGVAVIGNTMYYTSNDTNCVNTYTLSPPTDNGCLFQVTGAQRLASLAFDGTNLWIEDYSNTGKIFQYDITDTPTYVATFTPGNCGKINCDGLEYAYISNSNIWGCLPGILISNRGDDSTPYDAYQVQSLRFQCKAPFINTAVVQNTGIVWDGTWFYTSNIYHSKLVSV